MTQRLEVETALRAAAPHALVDAVRDALTTAYRATAVRLLLTDYGGTVLRSCDGSGQGAGSLSVFGSPEGRALGSQEPREQQVAHEDAVEHHLPVTVRGDRIGILTVRLPHEGSTPEVVDELRYVADLLGREILVAERDTDVYQRARRVSRLTLAAEMQWQLLPARAYRDARFALGAQLEPAYAVHGDNFDWSVDADELTFTVTNGMGEGIEASLLTHLAVNALRNARRAGIGLADQAALADQAVHDHYRGAAYVSTLLLRIELATGRVEAIDAGSPQMWRMRGKSVERIDLEAQLPLGMFEESHYTPQEFTLAPGDRLIFVSDGVYETLSPRGEKYAEQALSRAIHATSLLPAAMVPREVLRDVADYREAESLDDALVLCLDWVGDGHC
ncbi:Serine phosphatase RsbU, regulator of sigma subunit [Streptomyces sp. 2224.1]|uniref:PP2C family protein-serine/threonine phosphatase n=1 Tax=unclassified Streptomyces TaxID=2593676 RepID=UPI00087EAC32|nr:MULTISPECIES: PP2C family protein-serine/threonine phosphatase [unclassified Streptomyces]PBC85436.1 serine phosphatase RsbU (regulator of sigma subunit) [Streptomyces sp. 2321.6]SDR15118.1 Serine phosphatase RsbU, regulator of sigma subunit [Streptomyces sp. KS_16]SED67966.1 Serine phosphatase RsbU, regulator of sigma subunit [Streptomyces sp. 2133.1]SEE14600.1 Serine phosphatase RsbU, regulator of sigma subunit [Streptomyces sp. 2112.3]SEE32358.1 Serine phosphatase RsbU, regulator of sigm